MGIKNIVLLLISLLVIGECIPSWKLNSNYKRRERKFDHLSGSADMCNKQKLINQWYTQKMDHFNTKDLRNYQQYYQVNWEFYNPEKKNPVVFLNIGGEGPISKRWVCFYNYTYMQLAIEYDAIVVQLEHRFFGNNKDLPLVYHFIIKFLGIYQRTTYIF